MTWRDTNLLFLNMTQTYKYDGNFAFAVWMPSELGFKLSSSICLNHLYWTQVTRQWRTYHIPEERACNKIIIELCTKQVLDEVWYTPTNCWIIYHFQNKKQAQVMNHCETMLLWSDRVWMCTLCSDSFTRANKNRVLSKLNERKRIELINYLQQGWKTC